jgi:Ca-activated chloride channel homolog
VPVTDRWPLRHRVVAGLVAGGALLGSALVVVQARSRAAGSSPVRILADAELADMAPLLRTFSRSSGTDVVVDHVSGAELRRRASAPGFAGTYDAVWTAENDTARLPAPMADRLDAGRTVMSSPLVLGLRPAALARLSPTRDGSAAPTWAQLITAGRGGSFTFAMSDPVGADAAALLPVATALAGPAESLTPSDLYRISPQIRAFRRAQVVRGVGEPESVEAFARSGADALLTQESRILALDARPGTEPGRRLRVLAPGGRAVYTRYQLHAVLPARAGGGTAGLDRLGRYLASPPARAWITARTHRRTAVPGAPDPAFPVVRPVAVPRRPEIQRTLTGIYLDDFHYPTRVLFLLDVSGSMRGRGIARLRRAFRSLDATVAGRHGQDAEILLVPFADRPGPTRRIVVRARDPRPGLARVAREVARLRPGGGTGIYRALVRADEEIGRRSGDDGEQFSAVFLITDGRNTTSTGPADFRRHRRALDRARCGADRPEGCHVPVSPVLVGDADLEEMRELATDTGGRVEDARRVDLSAQLRRLTAGR